MEQHTQSVLSAAERGDKKAMENCISEGKANVCDEEGSTPLMYAAANGKEEIIRMLLDPECIQKNGLEPDKQKRYFDLQNIYGWTALMQAACYGHLNVVMLLLQRGANIKLMNKWGASALVGASQGGYFGVVHKLLNLGAEVNPEEDASEVKTLTPLMAAAQCGHVEILRDLLRVGARVETKLKTTGWTALMLAALNNQTAVVEILVQNGTNKDEEDINGKKAVDLAAALNNKDVTMFLVEGKARREISDSEFFEAIKSGNVDLVEEMLAKKRALASISDKDGVTPLMLATRKGYTEICKTLLLSGANVNAQDSKHGWSALLLATHHRNYEVVKLLGQHGVDVNVRGKTGSSAFDVANMIADVEMIRLIANISVERLQQQKSSNLPLPPPASPSPFQKEQTDKKDELPSKPTTAKEPAVSKGKEQNNKVLPIDMSELTRRFQNAYSKVPTPTITLDVSDNMSSPRQSTPTTPRFPMSRAKGPQGGGGSHLSTPTSISPSSSVSSTELLSSPQASSFSPSFGKNPAANSSSPKSTFVKKPTPSLSFLMPNQRGSPKNSPEDRASMQKANKSANLQTRRKMMSDKNPLVSPNSNRQFMFPRSSAVLGQRARNELPSFLQLRHNSRDPHFASLAGPKLNHKSHSVLSSVPQNQKVRNRSYTDPVSSMRHPPAMKKGRSQAETLNLKAMAAPPINFDLKSTLEEASLGQYYLAFEEQEVDYQSFVSFSDKDLSELGVSSPQDRRRMMTVIKTLSSPSSTSTIPEDQASPVFVFQ